MESVSYPPWDIKPQVSTSATIAMLRPCEAIHPKIPNGGTKYGDVPYDVSLAKWLRRSTAIKTWTQNIAVRKMRTHSCHAMDGRSNPNFETKCLILTAPQETYYLVRPASGQPCRKATGLLKN